MAGTNFDPSNPNPALARSPAGSTVGGLPAPQAWRQGRPGQPGAPSMDQLTSQRATLNQRGYYQNAPTAQTGGTAGGAVAPASSGPTYGTASGPGILQQWFNERAGGTDPGWEYGIGRANTALNNQYAAMGLGNSGANAQAHGDMLANAMAQREGQLDTLAGGASGERQGAINSMFNQGLGLAGGEAGTMGQYDLGGANAMNTANGAILSMMLNKAGVPGQATNQGIKNGIGIASLFG